MKLYMKQKAFSWRDRFYVKDEDGTDKYFVEGEIFSWGKKLHVYDAQGTEVAFIRQKVMSLLLRYFVDIGGKEVCTVVQKFSLFKPKYAIEGLNWHMKGNFLAHEYVLTDGARQVMQLSKKLRPFPYIASCNISLLIPA